MGTLIMEVFNLYCGRMQYHIISSDKGKVPLLGLTVEDF